jgi:hypothetical protein
MSGKLMAIHNHDVPNSHLTQVDRGGATGWTGAYDKDVLLIAQITPGMIR